mgnify:CR=1 FL=1
MKTNEVCDRPLDPFGPYLHSFGVLLLLFSFPDKHAGIAERALNSIARKGGQRVEDPLAGAGQSPAGVQRQHLWGSLLQDEQHPQRAGAAVAGDDAAGAGFDDRIEVV